MKGKMKRAGNNLLPVLYAILASIIAIVPLIVWIKFFLLVSPPELTYEKAQELFDKYTDAFEYTASFVGTKEEGFIIDKVFYDYGLDVGNFVEHNSHFDTLFKKCKCQRIDNYYGMISFQLWSTMDYGRGVCYIEDMSALDNPYLLELKPLDSPCWYFYVEE